MSIVHGKGREEERKRTLAMGVNTFPSFFSFLLIGFPSSSNSAAPSSSPESLESGYSGSGLGGR